MKQGTVSVLLGCHSPVHSLLVALAWRKVHGRWPRPWEMGCILLHDIGHWGRQYLDDPEEKAGHWRLGARVAFRLFGPRGYQMVAGHDAGSGLPESPLYRADKYSWHLAPRLWLWSNAVFEPKIAMGYTRWEAVRLFKKRVAENVQGAWKPTHSLYLERCKGRAHEL